MLVNYDSNDQLSSLNGSRGLASFEGDFGEGEAAHLRVEAYNPGRVSRLELRPEWAAVDHPDGPVTGAAGRFGQSFAADDGVLVIGGGYESVTTASGDCQSGCDRAGRVYVYEGIGDTAPAVLQAPTPKARDYYGYDVDISGDTIVVGAPRVDHIGSGATAADNGQVFVYVRPAGGWRSGMQPTAAFTNSGLGASGTLAAVVDGSTYPACPTYPGRNHRFGDGVAISRDERTVVVTSRDARSPAHDCAASVHTDGMAYVFERNDNGTAGWENDNGAGRAVLWPSTTVRTPNRPGKRGVRPGAVGVGVQRRRGDRDRYGLSGYREQRFLVESCRFGLCVRPFRFGMEHRQHPGNPRYGGGGGAGRPHPRGAAADGQAGGGVRGRQHGGGVGALQGEPETSRARCTCSPSPRADGRTAPPPRC